MRSLSLSTLEVVDHRLGIKTPVPVSKVGRLCNFAGRICKTECMKLRCIEINNNFRSMDRGRLMVKSRFSP